MSGLSLQLFASFLAELNYQPFDSFRSTKAQALLIYLVSEPAVAHDREELMTLLWPGMPQESARTNLRQVVYQLRKAIPEIASRDGSEHVPLLISERQTVQLNPEADVEADILTFDALLEAVRAHRHSSAASCTLCQGRLEEALALYQGPFLADFVLEDSNEFETWAQRRREAYRRWVMDALAMLAEGQLKRGEYGQAQVYAQRQLALDNLDERATRQLMEALARDGHRHEALAVYEEAVVLLREELNMSPAAQTTRLAEQIESDSLEASEPKRSAVRGYKLLDEVGAGAFGIVHRAYQPVIGREVVIKIIRPRYANHPDFIRRFEAEAQTIARLEHPYIVPLYDYWREPDNAYLVMRWLRGGNLEERLAGGPLEPGLAAGVVDQLAAALYAAHRQHIIHRDVKAANILLDEDGNAYLSDFSVAKDLLTDEDPFGLAGSVEYLSPEQLLKEDLSPQTDQYSLGIVIYQMLTGNSPFVQGSSADVLRRYILSESLPLVASQVPGMSGTVDDVLQRATAKKPGDRYPDMIALARAFHRAVGTVGVETLAGETLPVGEAVEAEAAKILNPYKGLQAFQESDAGTFFGREALVERLLGRIEQDGGTRFLAVVGPSGGGKSSAVKAGLLPTLRGGAIPGSENWFISEMTPGRDPIEELAVALMRVAVEPPADMLQTLLHDERGLVNVLERILPEDENGETPQLLLLIDQFEELFTLTLDDEVRDHFINSLLAALNDPDSRLRAVATLRADFYDRPLQVQDLGELLRRRTEVVLPLTPAELERAISQPASLASVALEAGLLAGVTADVIDQPGTLPLMQYALTELFEQREDDVLTVEAYQEIGGVSGALGSRADEIYQGLAPEEQEAARQLFLRLVTLGEGAEDTRRRVLREELEALEVSPDVDMGHIIDTFGQYRLLTFDRDPVTRSPTVEVAHEALLREWPHLREWLDESRADVRLQRLLAGETAGWQKTGQDDSYLLRGARLDQYDGWSEEANVLLTEDEKTFLAFSFAARDQRLTEEEARRQRELEAAQQLVETEKQRAEEQAEAAAGLRRRAFILAGALGIAALLAIAAFFFANQSSQNALAAEQNAVVAQENAELASTREAQAVISEQQALANEARAEENAQLAETATLAEAQAAEEAEAAQQVAEEQRIIAEEQKIVAEQERETAQQQAQLARSRELASAALNDLDEDPERSILLALQALSTTHTIEAEEVLHQAVQSSRVRQTIAQVDDFVGSWVVYHPDGSRLFISGENGGKMWDLASEEVVFTQPVTVPGDVQSDEISDLWINRSVFSPDGSLLIVSNEAWAGREPVPGLISIVDADSGEEILSFEAHDDGIQVVAINAEGTQIASGSVLGLVKLWDLPATLEAGTGQEVAALCCHDDWVYTIDFSPDGSRLATASGLDQTVRVWDTATGRELFVVEMDASDAVFSQDGAYLVVGIDNNELLVLDAVSGEIRSAVPAPAQNFHTLLFSPDGTRLATSSTDGKARIWEYSDGELDPIPLVLSGHKGFVVGASFTPDGRYLATGGTDGTARVWDVSLDGRSELGTYAHEDWSLSADFSPDGSWLASSGVDGSVKIWDTAAREERFTLTGHEDAVVGVAIHPDGHTLATSSNDGTVRVWDARTGAEQLVIEAHEVTPAAFLEGAKGISYAPDGQRLASSGADGFVRVWDAASGAEIFELAGHDGIVTVAEYSPDGHWLVSAAYDETIRVWDPADGRELWTLVGEPGAILEATFSKDGSRLLVSFIDGQSEIWSFPDPETGPQDQPELLLRFQHDPQFPGKGDFSPDGNLLAVAGDGQTSLHDADTGDLLVDLGHGSGMASFSPDGRVLATAGLDGLVRLFAVEQDDLMALAQSRLTRTLTDDECRQYLHLDACPQS